MCRRAVCSVLQVRLWGWADVTCLRVQVLGRWSLPVPHPVRAAVVTCCRETNGFKHRLWNVLTHTLRQRIAPKWNPQGNPRAAKLARCHQKQPALGLYWTPCPCEYHEPGGFFWLFYWPAELPGKGEESSCSAGCGWEGVRGCLEQVGELQLLSPGCFQKTEGFALKEKEKKRFAEKSGIWLNLHRCLRITLIPTSLRWMESIQPSTKFSLFADLFCLLRVSHSSGVYRRVNLIYYEMPHCGMKCFVHRQDQKVSLNWKAELHLIIFKGERKQNGRKNNFP